MVTVVDAALDLLLGGACAGCRSPGRALCRACRASLPRPDGVLAPRPSAPVPVPCLAGGAYDGVLRELVVAHKEHGVLSLAAPLGAVLAAAVEVALAAHGDAHGVGDGRVVLVPVPSRRSATRARGHDPTRSLAREAARVLRARGVAARATPLLRLHGRVVDQAGLDLDARARNLAGAMALGVVGSARSRRLGPATRLVVVDDVLTTGATAGEACAALRRGGLDVLAVATVAATPRRHEASAQVHGQSSG